DLICFHPVFLSQENKPQICVELQLAVFLCRLGSTGIIQAIVTQKETFIKWPTLEE
ncbi:4327_t:CDS:2, partial [Funneliformis geosporum]